MKWKSAYLFLILLGMVTQPMRADNYEKQWKQVQESVDRSLPQTALEQVTAIYQRASAEQNTPQMMKAFRVAMECRKEVTPDSFYVDVRRMEEWASQTTVASDKAMLHFMLGDLMIEQARNAFRFDGGKPDATYPEDMRDWSSVHFMQRTLDYYLLALADMESLGTTPMQKYAVLLDNGNEGECFTRDLLHAVGLSAVRTIADRLGGLTHYYKQSSVLDYTDSWALPVFLQTSLQSPSPYDRWAHVLRIYQQMLQYYLKQGNRDAVVMLDISRLKYMNGDTDAENKSYYEGLNALKEAYSDSKAGAEIYFTLARYLVNQSRNVEALHWLDEGIRRFPKYKRLNALKELRHDILAPACSVRVPSVVYPGKQVDVLLSYRNLTELELNVHRVKLHPDSLKANPELNAGFCKKHARAVAASVHSLVPTTDYLRKDTVIPLSFPAEGVYVLEVGSKKQKTEPVYKLVQVSRLQILCLPLSGHSTEVVVVDSESGHPVPGAVVVAYVAPQGYPVELWRKTAGQEGKLECDLDKIHYLKAIREADLAMPSVPVYGNSYYNRLSAQPADCVRLFTDRSIYRPGQTVRVAGLVYHQQADSVRVLSGKKHTMRLLDANFEQVAVAEASSDLYGSFSVDFVLPSVCLSGTFVVECAGERAYIQVEEYKRPTFEVEFYPVEGDYQIGDSVWVSGSVRTFSGMAVQEAVLNYTIARTTPWWWRAMPKSVLHSGKLATDAEGRFRIPVYLEPSPEDAGQRVWYRNFVVEVAATDAAGETRHASTHLPVGSSSCYIEVQMPLQWVKEKPVVCVPAVKNFGGETLALQGTCKLYRTDDKKHEQVLWETDFVSGQPLSTAGVQALLSGQYTLVTTVADSRGRVCTRESEFTLFSLHDKQVPSAQPVWSYVDSGEFGEGKDASFLFGTGLQNVYVFYDVFAGTKRIESSRFLMSDSLVRKDFEYREAYGDGILVKFAFVKDGELHQRTARITKVAPEKQLCLKWNVFRDCLLPGRQEQWSLHVSHPDGRPAIAQLLAVLYDASLDALRPHRWSMNMYFDRYVPMLSWRMESAGYDYGQLLFPVKRWNVPAWMPDELTRFNLFLPSRGKEIFACVGDNYRSKSLYMTASTAVEAGIVKDVAFEEEAVELRKPESPAAVRTNFSETAFFYPQLQADADGNVLLSFLLPESLTEWKFMGLAHTQQMDWGLLEARAVARKDFMLKPNMPRFLRAGDVTTIAATLTNLTDSPLRGMVQMQLFDPNTEKVYLSQKLPFASEAGKQATVSFRFEVKEEWNLLACRMVAEAGSFSDGEQHYLPVLTNKEWITESVPMTVTGQGPKKYDLTGLFNNNSQTATNRRLTVEFSASPIWYAIQALSSLANPLNDNAMDWVAAYYANRLGAYIVQQNPGIQRVFARWQAQGLSKATFMSQLEKNQELKNLMLEETPWLADAKDETERRRRIALLFDLNALQHNHYAVLQKLKSLQLPDGSWSWYKGMKGSRYVTQSVVETLVRLQHLTGEPLAGEMEAMYRLSFAYLHEEALREYRQMLKQEEKGNTTLLPSEQTLQYLYLCAMDSAGMPEKYRKAHNYFLDLLARSNGSQTIYGKARSAFVMQRSGQTDKAQDFIRSLKEYAVDTPEGGMYYDTHRAEYSFFSYRIPTQVAVIEAMDEVAKDGALVEKLKLWLLQQKRAQAWESSPATVDAVYALLQRGCNLMQPAGEVKLTLGGNVWSTASVAADNAPTAGYIKHVLEGDRLPARLDAVSVEKQHDGLAWGAVYAQCLDDVRALQQQGDGLAVTKTYRVERNVDGCLQQIPLEQAGSLRIGDKVLVQLSVRAGQDMDFVQLKDERAVCLEPIQQLSGYRYADGIGAYVAVKDASTHYFFDRLPKGVYVLNTVYHVTRSGEYTGGIATLQSAYAPEWVAHTASEVLTVE